MAKTARYPLVSRSISRGRSFSDLVTIGKNAKAIRENVKKSSPASVNVCHILDPIPIEREAHTGSQDPARYAAAQRSSESRCSPFHLGRQQTLDVILRGKDTQVCPDHFQKLIDQYGARFDR